ncbi:hypothetical protein [Pseudomonas citronellolis]|uniref:hypothetical protein n=1 Tax=Pseudomonas citronellolis TaxID=53408 RepID=UPI0021C082C4|nr:hypothetical protein [Pseudomonas citronellolis]UXJ53041.1 hypothetical protein N5P21_02155 [Pseudomonas citronellolis]
MNASTDPARAMQLPVSASLTRRGRVALYLGVALATLGLLALRVGNPNLIMASLWAEDGRVFIEQASRDLESMWSVYAGYIHLYPRLAALIARAAPLLSTPLIFNLAWLCAYLAAAWTLLHYALRHTGNPLVAALLCLAFSVTPQTGETLFTLTNSQWYIGTALLLYMCHWDRKHLGLVGNVLLAVACLTGPFVLLGLPIALYIAVVSGGRAKSRTSYAILLIGACVQATVLALNGRPNMEAPLDTNLLHWLRPFQAYLCFGKSSSRAIVLSLGFWIAGALAISHSWRQLHQNQKHTLAALLLMATICFLAGLSTAKHEPQVLSPLGVGARYFVIPYALSFLAIAICLPRNPRHSLVIFSTFSVISCLYFSTVDRGEFQWKAYARFAEQAPGISIPLAPELQSFPGWSAYPMRTLSPGKSHDIDLTQLTLLGLQRSSTGNELIPTETNNQVSFRLDQCKGSRYVGLLVDAERPAAGDVQVYWGTNYGFDERHSLRRYYPAGHVVAQLAFRKSRGDDTVRLDLSESLGALRLNRVQAYCLDKTL